MNSKMDQLDLKKGVKNVIKNVGKNFGKIQEIKNSELNNDAESKFAGIVWEDKESCILEDNSQKKGPANRISSPAKTFDTDIKEGSYQAIEIEIDALQRTTVFSNKVSMWIS